MPSGYCVGATQKARFKPCLHFVPTLSPGHQLNSLCLRFPLCFMGFRWGLDSELGRE